MAHGVTLTLRAIQPTYSTFYRSSRDHNNKLTPYRNDKLNPDHMPRAKHRNILFGRNAVGNTTPVERQEIWRKFTKVTP